jgi:hypothetical protein
VPGLDAPGRLELTGAGGKELALGAAPTIYIGGPGEDGEPAVAGVSVVIRTTEPTVAA